ncbi:MAG: hypothetical protein IT381_07920 [Deltaproteobacteria bacterium]|nr:hypothetical protein [Deltaproteobacteria bacterium]
MILLLLAVALPQSTYVLHMSDRSGVSVRQQKLLSQALTAELEKYDGVRVLRDLAPFGGTSCVEAEKTCWAKIFAGTQADGAIVVTAVSVEDTDVVTLALLDPASGDVQKMVTKSATKPEHALDLVGALVQELLPAKSTPFPSGVALEWKARWRPKPAHVAWFATTTAVSVASLAAGLGLAIAAQMRAAEYQALANSAIGGGATVNGAQLVAIGRGANELSAASRGLIVSAGVFAAASLVLAFFTDFGSDKSWSGAGMKF